jgi:hypothetical protein
MIDSFKEPQCISIRYVEFHLQLGVSRILFLALPIRTLYAFLISSMRTAYALPIPFFLSSLPNQIRRGAMILCGGIDRLSRNVDTGLPLYALQERRSRRNKNLSLSNMRRRYIWGLRTKFHTFFTSAIQEVIDLASVTPSGNRTAGVYPVSIHFTD